MSESLLPYSYQDKNNLALEACIKQVFNIDPSKVMINPLENVPESLLPYLAKEYHVMGYEGWSLAKSVSQKRNLVVNSFIKHAQKGSIPSVKNALNDLNLKCEISEFYEYGGRPGHYIVKFLNLYEQAFSDELATLVREMVKNYAPASRILDYINWFLCSTGTVFVTSRLKINAKTIISTKGVVL